MENFSLKKTKTAVTLLDWRYFSPQAVERGRLGNVNFGGDLAIKKTLFFLRSDCTKLSIILV